MNKRDIWREMTRRRFDRFYYKILPVFLAFVVVVELVFGGPLAGALTALISVLAVGIPFYLDWGWSAERLRREQEDPEPVNDDYGPVVGHQRYNPMDDW